MMLDIVTYSARPEPLPQSALLRRYVDSGDYTDCFATLVDGVVSHDVFVETFYTTFIFKIERFILSLFSLPSTDEEAAELARARRDSFAAWRVEQRDKDQLLLTDVRGHTRSWLAVIEDSDNRTRLYFGSAIIKEAAETDQRRKLRLMHRAILGFHLIYSRILLNAARRRIRRVVAIEARR